MNKGQSTIIIVGIIAAVATIGGSWLTGWFGASKRVGEIEKNVAIVKTTESLHYMELKEDVKEIKTDIKTILNLLRKNASSR